MIDLSRLILKLIQKKDSTKVNTYLGDFEAGDMNLSLLYYPAASQQMRDVLHDYRFHDGEFISVLSHYLSPNYLEVVIAIDKNGIKGWSGIYKSSKWSEERTIGVYVSEEHRHLGIGGRLKNEAIKICKIKDFDFSWQDSHSRDWFHRRNSKWV